MSARTALPRMLAAALPLALAACASVQPQQPRPAPPVLAAARTFHEAIDLTGRLSVRYQGREKEEAVHGSFSWEQKPAHTMVTLLSPLGQTVAVIDALPQRATLTQAGQPPRSAADVDALTADTLGWPLPVAGLRDWLQGFAIDRAGRRLAATPSDDEIVTREGWRLRYANWQSDPASSTPHPKRIDLARSTAQAGEVSIRIVIDTWQAH